MNLLFIKSFIDGDYNALKLKLFIIGLIWVFVFVAIIFDLVSGYRKAKQRGEARTSYGLKRTVSKFALYYTGLLFAFMFDVLIMYILTSLNLPAAIPFISITICGYLLYVEIRSILEKAEEKEKARLSKNLGDLLIVLEHKDDLVNAIREILSQNQQITDKNESNQ